MDKFQEIRPYQDAEVKAVLASLLRDSDMLDSIARFYAPKLSRFLPFLHAAQVNDVQCNALPRRSTRAVAQTKCAPDST